VTSSAGALSSTSRSGDNAHLYVSAGIDDASNDAFNSAISACKVRKLISRRCAIAALGRPATMSRRISRSLRVVRTPTASVRRAPRRDEAPSYNRPRCVHGCYLHDGCRTINCPDLERTAP
jgi:hypothetical protein